MPKRQQRTAAHLNSGNGIAAVFAKHGHEVTLHDPVSAALDAVPARVGSVLKDLGWDAGAVKRVLGMLVALVGIVALVPYLVLQFKGLTVDKDTAFRKSIRESKGQYRVAKNTLLRLAVKDTTFEALGTAFKGASAVATALALLTETFWTLPSTEPTKLALERSTAETVDP